NPSAGVRGYLASGSLFSSTAGSLGFADGAHGVVTGLSAGTVEIKPALRGDINLDGQVAFSDLLVLAQHYNTSNAIWDQGDLNYDGTVGFADLLALAQNYGHAALAAAAR